MTTERTLTTRGRPRTYDCEVVKRLILERKDEMLQDDGYSIVSELNPIWSEISSRRQCTLSESALYNFVKFNKFNIREEIDPSFLLKKRRIESTQDSIDTSYNSSSSSSSSQIRKPPAPVNRNRSNGKFAKVVSKKNELIMENIQTRPTRMHLEMGDKNTYKMTKIRGDIKVMDSTATQFVWTVENFSHRYLATGEILTSTIFKTGLNNKDQWRLLLYPKGISNLDKNSVHIYLELIRTSRQRTELDVIFSIVKPGTNETTKDKKVIKQVFDQNGMKHGVENIMKSTEIPSFLENDILKVYCQFHPTPGYAIHSSEFNSHGADDRCPIDVESTNIEAKLLENPVKLSPRLCDQLWLQFQNPKNSDAVIIVKHNDFPVNEKFHVHKLILQVRSSVFSEMFEHQMEENSTYEIVIENMEPEVVEKMLQFIYTDSIDDFEEIAGDLLVAAHRYAVEALKTLCEQVLFEKIEVSNAVETLILAEKCESNLLKNRVAEFINKNLKRVTETVDYKALEESHPKLVCYLVRTIASQ